MNPWLARALRLAGLGVIVSLLYLFVRTIDGAALVAALRGARPWLLVPAVAVAYFMLWCAAFGLRIMLAPRYAVSTARLFRYTIVAYAGSVIAPARAGELARLWLLKERDGVPIADAAAAAVAHKLVDGLAMFVIAAPIPLCLPDLPAWVGRTIGIGALIAIAVFGALYVAVGRIGGEGRTSWLARFIAGMHVLRSPRRLWLVLAAQLVAWAADLGMIACVLAAVGIDLPLPAGLLILFTLNVTLVVPTPGHLGALEVGVFAATRLLGVPDERALAFALLYHACLIVPILVAGLALELPLLLGRTPAPD